MGGFLLQVKIDWPGAPTPCNVSIPFAVHANRLARRTRVDVTLWRYRALAMEGLQKFSKVAKLYHSFSLFSQPDSVDQSSSLAKDAKSSLKLGGGSPLMHTLTTCSLGIWVVHQTSPGS